MTIRTTSDLTDRLDRELAWRKKELSDLKYYIDLTPANAARRKVLGRCAVAMLYAHWEGFVKIAGRCFLEFVAMQRLRNEQLHPNLLTLSMRHQVKLPDTARKLSDFGKITEFFLSGIGRRSAIPFKSAVDTRSNLSSSQLQEIVWCLGLDYAAYETKEHFIDSVLLGRRNSVAHGEGMIVDPDEFDAMRDHVIEMMTTLKTQMENAAVLKTYMK
ncbi:MAG: MAE_28990/MAE_18760 family HEPN-like nuclease [Thermodesulfobacteriota bacterium]